MNNKRTLKIFLVLIIIAGLVFFFGKNSEKKEEQMYKDSLAKAKTLSNEEWKDSDGTIYTNLSYGNGTNTFDLYIPNGIDILKKQPVMLFLHGGSWESGSKADMDYFCKFFTKARIYYSNYGLYFCKF